MNDFIDQSLVARYGESAPRYTSYPPATQFHEQFKARDLIAAIGAHRKEDPWSLYVHIPFCESVCYYCACHKVVTKHHERGGSYVSSVARELALLAPLLGPAPRLDQLHWGGGTPTFLGHDDMRALMVAISDHFVLRPDDSGEYSIEIDPRHASDPTLVLLRDIGFNRLSLGIQDFDPEVQRAINRKQSYSLVNRVISSARALGFKSISVDLIYGLPHQNRSRFARTLDRVLSFSPDRISLFHYAHLPDRFKPQRRIETNDLPDGPTKLAILGDAIRAFREAGYVYIGLDHFAKSQDELARAQRDRTLGRNFQGYSTHGDLDVLGIGPSAVSRIGSTYSQNAWELRQYTDLIDSQILPVRRGFELSGDDQIRRDLINSLLCHMECDIGAFEARHSLFFARYFASEIERLAPFVDDGLVTLGDRIIVTERGQMLVRAICAVFDRYLAGENRVRFSRVI